jgi:hypothetical protein
MKLYIDLLLFLVLQLALIVYVYYYKKNHKDLVYKDTDQKHMTDIGKLLYTILAISIVSVIVNIIMLYIDDKVMLHYFFYAQIIVTVALLIAIISLLVKKYDKVFLGYIFLHVAMLVLTKLSLTKVPEGGYIR